MTREPQPIDVTRSPELLRLVIDATDHNPHAALAIAHHLQRERWRIFAGTYVVAECHALLLARLNRRIALQFLDQRCPLF